MLKREKRGRKEEMSSNFLRTFSFEKISTTIRAGSAFNRSNSESGKVTGDGRRYG